MYIKYIKLLFLQQLLDERWKVMLNTLMVVFAPAEETRSLPGKKLKIHKSKSIFSVCLHIVDLKPEFRFTCRFF